MVGTTSKGENMVEKTIAEELAKDHKAISISEFFERNRHLLGYDNPTRALLTVVKELVDNSLDACEDARMLPRIWIEVKPTTANRFRVMVKDNGPGIVDKHIPLTLGKLLYGSKFFKLFQSRGQQGIGASGAILYSQLTVGKPTTIVSSTGNGKTSFYELMIDVKKNEPKIISHQYTEDGRKWHGLKIEMEIEGRYIESKQSIPEYLKQVAIGNPYAEIIFDGPNGRLEFPRGAMSLPPLPKEIKPHPYGVELGVFRRMLAATKSRTILSFLMNDFSRVGKTSAEEICRLAGIDPKISPKRLGIEDSEKLFKAMKNVNLMRPPTDCLSPLGEDLIIKGLKKGVKGEFFTAVTRPPAVYRGNPFVVECCTGDTRIVLEDGRRISIKNYVEKDMREFKVFSMDEDLKILPKKVLKTHKIPLHHRIYKITTRSGREIKLTDNNEIPIIQNGKIRWTRVDSISKGDYIATPRRINIEGNNTLIIDLLNEKTVKIYNPDLMKLVGEKIREKFGSYKECSKKIKIKYERFKAFFRSKQMTRPSLLELKKMIQSAGMEWNNIKERINRITVVDNEFMNPIPINIPRKCNEDLLYVLGLVNSDGCMVRKSWRTSFVNNDEHLHRLFKEKIKKLFGLDAKRHGKESYINNKSMFIVLQKVRERLTTLPTNLILSWLKGFADGDGWIAIRKNGQFHSLGLATATKERAKLVQFLLLRVGILSKIKKETPSGVIGFIGDRKVVTKKDKYDITIEDRKNVELFHKLISFRQQERKKKLIEYINTDVKSRSDIIPMIGPVFRELRQEFNLTQSHFSFSDQTIRQIEKNRQNVTRDHLQQIVDTFDGGGEKLKYLKNLAFSDILWDKVVRISQIKTKDKYVYDLTTETGNFVADRIVIHNCGIAYGGELPQEGTVEVMRLSNRVPLLYQAGDCAITKAIVATDWKRYGFQQSGRSLPTGPGVILVHFASVWVPFISESKQAIASYPVIIKEIKLALQEAGRRLQRYVSGKRRYELHQQRKRIFERYIPEVALSLSKLTKTKPDPIMFKLQKMAKKVTEVKSFESKADSVEEAG